MGRVNSYGWAVHSTVCAIVRRLGWTLIVLQVTFPRVGMTLGIWLQASSSTFLSRESPQVVSSVPSLTRRLAFSVLIDLAA